MRSQRVEEKVCTRERKGHGRLGKLQLCKLVPSDRGAVVATRVGVVGVGVGRKGRSMDFLKSLKPLVGGIQIAGPLTMVSSTGSFAELSFQSSEPFVVGV